MTLNHPDGCGCGVCRKHRARLAADPTYREEAAGHAEFAHPTGDPGVWSASDEGGNRQPENVEHTTVVEHRAAGSPGKAKAGKPGKAGAGGKPGKRGKPGKPGKRGKRGRAHSFLRLLVGGLLLLWVIHSFYPGLDVPLVPGIVCSNGSSATLAAAPTSSSDPAGIFHPPPRPPLPLGPPGTPFNPSPLDPLLPKVGDLARDTIAHAAKRVALFAVASVFHAAGTTLRAMADHPPKVTDVAAGLHADEQTIGRAIGFTTAAFHGANPAALTDANAGVQPVDTLTATGATGQPVSAAGQISSSGCGACPSQTLPAVTGHGIDLAARAVAATWPTAEQTTALAVVGAESGYRPDVRNYLGASGLFQMRMPMHADLFAGRSWRDPVANAHAAYLLWKANGWQPWTTHASGVYRMHLAEAAAALARVRGSGGGVVAAADVTPAACNSPVLPAVAHGPHPPDNLAHLQPITRAALAFIRSRMGFTGTIYGYSYRNIAGTHTLSEHAKGLALDMMTTDLPTGNRIAAYFSGPGAVAWRTHDVIWQDRIWTSEGQRWKPYGDHGNPTLNHMDHVHVDFHQ